MLIFVRGCIGQLLRHFSASQFFLPSHASSAWNLFKKLCRNQLDEGDKIELYLGFGDDVGRESVGVVRVGGSDKVHLAGSSEEEKFAVGTARAFFIFSSF